MFKGGIQDPDWSQESQLIWSGLQGFTSVYHDRGCRNQETGGFSKDCPSPEKVKQQIFSCQHFSLAWDTSFCKCVYTCTWMTLLVAKSSYAPRLTLPARQQGQPSSGEMAGACSHGRVIPAPQRVSTSNAECLFWFWAFEPHEMGFFFYNAIISISASTEIIR